jgi:hypothetical protein
MKAALLVREGEPGREAAVLLDKFLEDLYETGLGHFFSVARTEDKKRLCLHIEIYINK